MPRRRHHARAFQRPPARRRLHIEPLEPRQLLSYVPHLLKQINPPFNMNLTNFAQVGTQTYFLSKTGSGTGGLWKTDGASAGTTLVRDLGQVGLYVQPLGDKAVVVTATQLWSSDGTSAGTVPLATFPTSTFQGFYRHQIGNQLFVGAGGLWKTDGTVAGTTQISTVTPGPGNALIGGGGADINDTIYFLRNNTTQLWKSNGASSGTVMVAELPITSGFDEIAGLKQVGNKLYFFRKRFTELELWTSDGTSSGTTLVKGGFLPFDDTLLPLMAELSGKLIFGATDTTHGAELWQSDGTSAGTILLADIQPGFGSAVNFVTPFAFPPAALTKFGGELYFRANDGAHGWELWKTNGTSTGTVLVRDIRPGPNGGATSLSEFVNNLAPSGGALYFGANDGVHGPELWKTDGTSSGTVMIADALPASSYGPFFTTNLGGTVYFMAVDSQNFEFQPWVLTPTPDLAVVDLDGRKVLGFDPAGAPRLEADAGDGLFTPISTAYDAAGNLYVADVVAGTAGRIYKIPPGGAASVFADLTDGLIAPTGMAFDAAGNLYVANYLGDSIVKLTPGGVASVFADSADGLNGPFDVAIDGATGNVFVANLDNRQVLKFTPAGAGSVFADAADGLLTPIAVAVSAAGDVYVSDVFKGAAGTLFKFTPAGVGSVFADAGDGLVTPTGLSFDAAGNLYVANYIGASVTKLTPAGVGSVFANAADGLVRPFDAYVTGDSALGSGPGPAPAPAAATASVAAMDTAAMNTATPIGSFLAAALRRVQGALRLAARAGGESATSPEPVAGAAAGVGPTHAVVQANAEAMPSHNDRRSITTTAAGLPDGRRRHVPRSPQTVRPAHESTQPLDAPHDQALTAWLDET